MKKILCILSICIMLVCLTGCNRQVIDTTWNYNKAIVSLPNGEVVEGKISSWRDYENSDQIQVKIDDKTYLVHATNVSLIAE